MGRMVQGSACLGLAVVVSSTTAAADEQPTAAEKKGRYALPFAMRPAIAPNLVRIDASLATRKPEEVESNVLTAGGKPIASAPDLGFYVRGALVRRSPREGDAATVLSNPLLLALYAPEIAPKVRLPLALGVGVPIGQGGGDAPDAAARAAILAGAPARQAMDGALFAPNYLTTAMGAGVAWIDHGLTVQLEATVFFLRRTRGESLDGESARTNLTSGVNVGYLLVPPYLTVNAEFHYQRWLSTPLAVEADEAKEPGYRRGLRDQATYGGGLRVNVPLGSSTIMRPGLGLFTGLDNPMKDRRYAIVQLDLPIAF